MAYQALVKWEPYYELPEPKEAVELKEEWMRDNDPVVDFYETMVKDFDTDFVPSLYAWDMYVCWLRETRPSTPLPSQKAFVAHLIEVASSGDEWSYPKSGKDGIKLSGAKWCPSLVDANLNGQRYKDRLRGIVRTRMWEWCVEHNTNPADLGTSYADVRRQLGLVTKDEE